MSLRNFLLAKYWSLYLRLRGASVGAGFQTGGSLDILLRDGAEFSQTKIGDNVSLAGKTYLRIRESGEIIIEDNVCIGTEVWLTTGNKGQLRICSHANIGSYGIYNGGHGLRIGPDCVIAGFVYMNSSDHGHQRDKLIREQPYYGRPIDVGGDVWIGGHCFITKGVTIGDGAVIGAGSVVVKDIKGYSIAVGNPARFLKERQ